MDLDESGSVPPCGDARGMGTALASATIVTMSCVDIDESGSAPCGDAREVPASAAIGTGPAVEEYFVASCIMADSNAIVQTDGVY